MKKSYLIILAGVLLAACGGKNPTAVQPLQTVNIDTLRAIGESATLQYPGRVKAADEVNLSFKVSGRIQRICVKEGEYVRAGQLVAIMDPTDYEVQLRATEAEHAQITAEADRVIKLHEEGATTDNNYDRAVYGKRQIDAKLKNHKDQLAYTRLTAPTSGYIQSKLFTGGEVVSAGMPVVTSAHPRTTISPLSAPMRRMPWRITRPWTTCSATGVASRTRIEPSVIINYSSEGYASPMAASSSRTQIIAVSPSRKSWNSCRHLRSCSFTETRPRSASSNYAHRRRQTTSPIAEPPQKGRGGYPSSPTASYTYIKSLQFILLW